MAALQELLAQLKQKGDSSKQPRDGSTHPTATAGTGKEQYSRVHSGCSHSMPPYQRHLGELLVHAVLWATIRQLQGLENVA